MTKPRTAARLCRRRLLGVRGTDNRSGETLESHPESVLSEMAKGSSLPTTLPYPFRGAWHVVSTEKRLLTLLNKQIREGFALGLLTNKPKLIH